MPDFLKRIKRKTLLSLTAYLLIPLGLNLLLFSTVYKMLGGSHIAFVDSGMLLFGHKNPELLSVWSQNNLGYIYSLFVSAVFYSRLVSFVLIKLVHSIKVMELILYGGISLAVYYSSYWAFYKMQKLLFSTTNLLFPALVAFFYSYNISIVLSAGVVDDTFHILIIAPFLLYLVLSQLQRKLDPKSIALQALFIGVILNTPPFSLAFLITMYLPLLFLSPNFFRIENLRNYLWMGGLSLLVGSFFIFNLVYAYINIARGVFFAPPIGTIDFIFLEKGMRGVLQFLSDWSISLYYSPPEPHPYYQYYLAPLGIIVTFAIWFFTLIGPIVNWKSIRNKRSFLFIFCSLLLAIFLIKGDQAPLGNLNLMLYKTNPIMGIFRTPGSKFGVPIMLYLSVLILFALNTNKYRLISIPLIVAVLAHTVIFFNPYRYIGYNTSRTQTYTASIPEDYKKVSAILNQSKKEGSVFLFPGINNGYFQLYDTKFLSQDLLGKMIIRPLIYSDDTAMRLSKDIINRLPEKFDPRLVGKASVRYILIRNDYDNTRYVRPDTVGKEGLIVQSGRYSVLYKSPHLTLYELNEKDFQKQISLGDLDDDTDILYSQISSYEYKIKTTIGVIENRNIVLRTSYHSDWVLKGLDENKYKIRHEVYDEFANSWKIKKIIGRSYDKDEKVELTIYFRPQYLSYFFGLVSVGTAVGILFYLVRFKK